MLAARQSLTTAKVLGSCRHAGCSGLPAIPCSLRAPAQQQHRVCRKISPAKLSHCYLQLGPLHCHKRMAYTSKGSQHAYESVPLLNHGLQPLSKDACIDQPGQSIRQFTFSAHAAATKSRARGLNAKQSSDTEAASAVLDPAPSVSPQNARTEGSADSSIPCTDAQLAQEHDIVAEAGNKRLEMLRKSVSQDLQAVWEQEKERAASRTLRTRLTASFRVAFQTYYTVLIYNTVIRLLKAVGADDFFRWLTPQLEVAFANMTGAWHTLENGERRPISLANNCDPDLTIPPQYSAKEFPFEHVDLEASQHVEYRTAHLLSLAMKLVYEGNDVIEDTAQRFWHVDPLAIIETASEAHKQQEKAAAVGRNEPAESPQSGPGPVPGHNPVRTATSNLSGDDGSLFAHEGRPRRGAQHDEDTGDLSYLPATKVILLRTKEATIASFRGTEATNLLNWRTDIQINMTRHKDLGGIHDGFYSALFHRHTDSEPSLFEDTVKVLKDAEAAAAEEGRAPLPLYIAGHSLGGAIATVFAQALAVQEPEVAARVGGVYTWGAPRAGDAAFARAFTTAYGDRSFRIRNAGDLVPFLIPSWLGYRHCGKEVYVSNFGRLTMDPADIGSTSLRENIGFPFLYLYNIVAGRVGSRRESWLRTLYRVAFMLVLPGFTNHFPCEYERQMRKVLSAKTNG